MRHRTTVLILSLATSTLAFGLFWRAFAAETNYTKYQMEFRYVTLDEAKSVIVRTIGSGALNLAYGEELLKGTRSSVLGASADWFNEHPDATIS